MTMSTCWGWLCLHCDALLSFSGRITTFGTGMCVDGLPIAPSDAIESVWQGPLGGLTGHCQSVGILEPRVPDDVY